MTNFFKRLHKYNQANLWIDAHRAREAKKEALQLNFVQEEKVIEVYYEDTKRPQLVFSQADVGHNQEEANKIQKLYDELKDGMRLSPLSLT